MSDYQPLHSFSHNISTAFLLYCQSETGGMSAVQHPMEHHMIKIDGKEVDTIMMNVEDGKYIIHFSDGSRESYPGDQACFIYTS